MALGLLLANKTGSDAIHDDVNDVPFERSQTQRLESEAKYTALSLNSHLEQTCKTRRHELGDEVLLQLSTFNSYTRQMDR